MEYALPDGQREVARRGYNAGVGRNGGVAGLAVGARAGVFHDDHHAGVPADGHEASGCAARGHVGHALATR